MDEGDRVDTNFKLNVKGESSLMNLIIAGTVTAAEGDDNDDGTEGSYYVLMTVTVKSYFLPYPLRF